MLLAELLEEYLSKLNSVSTRTNYRIAIVEFLSNFKSVAEIKPNAIENYKNKLRRKRSAQTVRARLSAVKSFLDYCWEVGVFELNPAVSVKAQPIKKYKNAKNITTEDFRAVLSKTGTSAQGLRDSLLFRLIYLFGDVDKVLLFKWDQGMPTPKMKVVKDTLLDAIKKVFNKRTYLTGVEADKMLADFTKGYLFFNFERPLPDSSKPLSVMAVRRLLKTYCQKAGFKENHIDFQALKRLRAKEIYEKTKSIEEVRRFCGHKSIQLTKIFLRTLK